MIDILIEIIRSIFGAARGPDAAKPGPRSATAGRIFAGVAAVVFGVYTLFVLRQMASVFGRFGLEVLGVLFLFYGVSGTTICGWFALRGHLPESRRRFTSSMRWERIVGGVGLAAGVLGPALLQPDANQGPLLGVLLTGPLGFVLGALFGWLRAFLEVGDATPDDKTSAAPLT
jgi:hypothetical protein